MWPAVAVGASIIGGIMQGNASQDAARTQANAARRASELQNQQFQQQRADAEPWRQAGMSALAGLNNSDFQRDFTMADFVADPGYNFRMQEGQKAIEAAASARGSMGSGGTLKALTQYGQNFASNEYQNAYNRFNSDRDRRFNRLSSLAGIGQTANSQVAQAGQNYANNVGNNMMAGANAQAAGQVGQANALNNSIGQGMNTWMQYQMMNKLWPKNSGGDALWGTSAGQSYNDYSSLS